MLSCKYFRHLLRFLNRHSAANSHFSACMVNIVSGSIDNSNLLWHHRRAHFHRSTHTHTPLFHRAQTKQTYRPINQAGLIKTQQHRQQRQCHFVCIKFQNITITLVLLSRVYICRLLQIIFLFAI